jgi:TnpA family transposase
LLLSKEGSKVRLFLLRLHHRPLAQSYNKTSLSVTFRSIDCHTPLYNESDLSLDGEHYTDTHGYTENNFAAFAMLGRLFAPRIRALHKQRIYCIDRKMDYKALAPLVCRNDRTIHMDWIEDQWDRLGHFYASLEYGHATASTAMKRLNGFSGKNHFYRANRELGRIFKTEYILRYMSDKALRQKVRKGLLKGEQIHALARI